MTATILHIDSSVLGDNSASRRLSADIVASLLRATPGAAVSYRDLAAAPLAHLSGAVLQNFSMASSMALVGQL